MSRPIPRHDRSEMVRLHGLGLSARDIARALGCHRDTVYAAVGTSEGRRPRRRKLDPTAALTLFRAGLAHREVARELGCSSATVAVLLEEARRAGLDRNPKQALADDCQGVTCRFPEIVLTPRTRCRCEEEPILAGEPFYCPCCHASGWDHWEAFANVQPLPPDPVAKRAESLRDGLEGGMGSKRGGRKLTEAERLRITQAVAGLHRKERRALQRAAREAERIRTVLAKAG